MVATFNHHPVMEIQWVSHGLVPAENMDRQSPVPWLPSLIPPSPSYIHARQLHTPPELFAGIFLPGLQMQGEASVAEMYSPSTAIPARITILGQSILSPPGMESTMHQEKRQILPPNLCLLSVMSCDYTTVDGQTSSLLLPQCCNL